MSGRSTFDELKHPRDKHGRFTKSRTVKATAKDKALAKAVAQAFSPSKDAGSPGYLAKVAGGKDSSPDLAGLGEVNTALRAGDENAPGVGAFDKSLITLPDDVLLSRRVPQSVFGSTDPMALEGMKVRDAGFAPAQLGTLPAEANAVRMHIAAPAGTKAAVNPATGEVILDRDTEMVVSHVEKNAAGGHDMYLTVLPKTGVKPGTGKTPVNAEPNVDEPKPEVAKAEPETGLKKAENPAGPERAAKPESTTKPAVKSVEQAAPKADAEADKPEGEAQVRADLMKLKVADLQSKMRERGLKPGKQRKSQLVDALVADEMGHDGKPEPSKPAEKPTEKATPKPHAEPKSHPAETPTADSGTQVKNTATGDDALAAAPLGLSRDGVDQDQQHGLASYRDGTPPNNYGGINKTLRGESDTSPDIQASVDSIDAAMAGSPLSKDVVVFRGIHKAAKMFGAERLAGDLTGMRWREDAYVSTAADAKGAHSFSSPGGLRMRVLVPAGTGAVDLSEPGDIDERELLLDRGHEFHVVADRGVVNGVREVDVQVGPKTGTKSATKKPAVAEPVREAAPTGKATTVEAPSAASDASPKARSETVAADLLSLVNAGVDRGTIDSALRDLLNAHQLNGNETPELKALTDLVHGPEGQIRRAVEEALAERGAKVGPGEQVMLGDLRRRLPSTMDRATVDKALVGMSLGNGEGHLSPESNQKTLTPAERAAAVSMGNQDNHMISFNRSDREAIAEAARKVSGHKAKPKTKPSVRG